MKNFNRNKISLLIFIFINIVFVVKYSLRINLEAMIFISICYCCLCCLICKYSDKLNNTITLYILITITFIGIILNNIIPLESLNVDRWEMISTFERAVENGDYPYLQKGLISGNYPGPSPFYFVLCYPFYKLNFYVGIPLFSLWLFYFVCKKSKLSNCYFSTILLAISPALLFEITTRSTIIFNSILIFCALIWLRNLKSMSLGSLILNGIVIGLLLNTRNVFIVAIVVFFFLLIREINYKKVSIWCFSCFCSFVGTYLILILLWGIDNFMEMNPFKVQSEFIIPSIYNYLFIILSIVAGLIVKNFNQAIFVIGIVLFICGLTVFLRGNIYLDFPG